MTEELKLLIKVEEVYLCCLDEQIPTVLLYNGRRYILENKEKETTNYDLAEGQDGKDPDDETTYVRRNAPNYEFAAKKTVELKQLVKDRNDEDEQKDDDKPAPPLGKVIARVSSGTLIHENPLREMKELKKSNKLTSLNMAKVLHKYHKGLKASTISTYRSGYRCFLNRKEKGEKADIRMNEPPKVYENVTDKDIEQVKNAITNMEGGTFDQILLNLGMTDYKLRLVLGLENLFEKYTDDSKEKYRLKA